MLKLFSHTHELQKALIHTPGLEIERLIPWCIEHPLTFDVEYNRHLPTLRKEHLHLVGVLKREIGENNVYQVSELLEDIFDTDGNTRRLILNDILGNHKVEAYEISLQYSDHQKIDTRSSADLANDMIIGYPREWKQASDGSVLLPVVLPKDGLRHVRDSIAVLPSCVILGAIQRLRRSGDTGIMRAILKYHPRVSANVAFDWDKELHETQTNKVLASPIGCGLEGGNIQVVSEDSIILGVSYSWSNANYDAQRYCFEKAIEKIFLLDLHQKIQRIYVVHIPNFQHFWHLDSVFNMIGPKSAIAMPYIFGYPRPMQDSISPLVRQIASDLMLSKNAPTYPFHLPSESDLSYSGMTEVYLREDFEQKRSAIPCGKPVQGLLDQLCNDGILELDKIVWAGGNLADFSSIFEHIRVALREQSSQACNVFVVRPFWTIAVDQNPFTLNALQNFLEAYNGHLEIVPGVEQVKSGGGPHCLVADLLRNC